MEKSMETTITGYIGFRAWGLEGCEIFAELNRVHCLDGFCFKLKIYSL